MSTVTSPPFSQPRLQHPAQGLHLDALFVGEAFVHHVAHKATRAIAALLDLAAVGVVDHVFKVDLSVEVLRAQ
jgi:hypothetical protein